jgi:putative ABC transport system ATP-binding protein
MAPEIPPGLAGRPPEPAIECRAVSAGQGGEARAVLKDVTCRVACGERLVVIGPSGSGKSTLLRLLNRLDEPLAGIVLLHGRPLREWDPLVVRRKVALVQQTPIVFEGTVRDNLRVRPQGTASPPDTLLEAVLEEVGLSADFAGREARELSTGEKQRVCLARALVPAPEVLLLDEPTSALDPKALGHVADLVLSLQSRRALALVVATHQRELLRRLDGKVLLLGAGTARAQPSAAEVEHFLNGT